MSAPCPSPVSVRNSPQWAIPAVLKTTAFLHISFLSKMPLCDRRTTRVAYMFRTGPSNEMLRALPGGSGKSGFSLVSCEGKTKSWPSFAGSRRAISYFTRSSIVAIRSSRSLSASRIRLSVGILNFPSLTLSSAIEPIPSGSSFAANIIEEA